MSDNRSMRVRLTIAATVLLLVAIAGAGAWWWQSPLDQADAAAARGDWPRAVEQYQAAQRRFAATPAVHDVVTDARQRAAAGELRARFQSGEYVSVVDRAAVVAPSAAAHYWTASALFALSQSEESADARVDLLGRASEEFRSVLEAAPLDWDALYNYELMRRLYDELKKKPETPPKLMIELLRPQPKDSAKPVKRAG